MYKIRRIFHGEFSAVNLFCLGQKCSKLFPMERRSVTKETVGKAVSRWIEGWYLFEEKCTTWQISLKFQIWIVRWRVLKLQKWQFCTLQYVNVISQWFKLKTLNMGQVIMESCSSSAMGNWSSTWLRHYTTQSHMAFG